MEKWKENPCIGCTRVEDPQRCDNKNCGLWRKWFFRRWNWTRALFLGSGDPCDCCPSPRQLCFEPCQQKQTWERRV